MSAGLENGAKRQDAARAEVDEAFRRARARRNLAIAGALAGFVALVFLITLVQLGGNVTDVIERPY